MTGFRQVGSLLLLDIHLRDSVSTSLPLDLGIGAGGDLPFDLSLTADVRGEFNLDFTFGIDLAKIGDWNEAFFVQIRTFSAAAVVQTYDLNAALQLGFLDAGIANGRIRLDATVRRNWWTSTATAGSRWARFVTIR